ncbi:hypothetical protein KKA47_04100 [bacterium]|nr:hypothetical protein [bacterium]
MFSKRILISVITALMLVTISQFAHSRGRKYMTVNASASIPKTGMTIDSSYDEKLDNLIPKYKIINAAVKNESMNLIYLDPAIDRWYIIDRNGKKRKGIINLRKDDPDTWDKLPDRLRNLIGYPLMVPTGGTVNIDLLFSSEINLKTFRALIFESGFFGQRYKIIMRND